MIENCQNHWKLVFSRFLSTLVCRCDYSSSWNTLKLCMLIKLYIKHQHAKIYGDSILDAHATSAHRLHLRKVIILLIRDFEQILLYHDSSMLLYINWMPTWMSLKWQIQSVIDRYAYPNTRKCFQRKNFEIVETSSLLMKISVYISTLYKSTLTL